MLNKYLMIIIDKKGTMTGMIDDERFVSTTSIDELIETGEDIIPKSFKQEDFEFIRHLYCAKKYAQMKHPDMVLSDDDMTMYYRLVNRGNILFINSKSHINMLLSPSELTDEQKETLRGLKGCFDPSRLWATSDNVFLDTFELDGSIFGTVEVADVKEDNINSSIDYLLNRNKIKKI